MKIGLYGGTFNPIHLGHMGAAKAAARYLGLDRLFLIPAGIPPHKAMKENMAEHRLAMTRLAAESMGLDGRVEVLDLELEREGKSYTLDTVRALKKDYPEDQLYLLMGTDMFFSFQNWYGPREIGELCTLAAFSREKSDDPRRFEEQKRLLRETVGAETVLVPLREVREVSSTELREELKNGRGQDLLCPAVYGYILREGLYGVEKDLRQLSLEDLRAAALSMLKGKRIPHVLGTEATAAKLALRWGADEETARRAALLHDCTKKLTREQHLALCRQYGIEIDEEEEREEQLLHGASGSGVARNVFGLGEDAVQAIRWHTIGRGEMTLLDKIIYLADYIEPTRDHCDLTELRELSMRDLDKAVLTALEMSAAHLKTQGKAPHPNSVSARDHLKGN